MSRFLLTALVGLAAVAGNVVRSSGGEPRCRQCGCDSNLKKVCRVECDTKKVAHTRYDVKSEDICLPGKSCHRGCEGTPNCGRVKTVKKLVKVESFKMIPTYKCVVETVCCNCGNQPGLDNHKPAEPRLASRYLQPETDEAPLAPLVTREAAERTQPATVVAQPDDEEAPLAPIVTRSEVSETRLAPIVSRPIPKKVK